MQAKLRLAYLTTHYPALSHTFILREVSALRGLGAEVHTISLRRTAGEHLLSRENRDAWESTYAVRPPRWRDLLGAHLAAVTRHPRAYAATACTALGLARPGSKARLWQVFYFGEAIAVWRHCARMGLRHIHAHHGSAPADVALLASRFGRAAGGGPGSWSMTVHGPTEFADVRRFALAEKVRRADAVVCISEFGRSQLMALVDDRHWGKLHVVHCGVSRADHEPVGEPAGTRPRVLCVGRLVPEKGHVVLLRALALLVQDGRDLEAVIVGSGPMRPRLERLAADLDVSDRVLFTGALGHEEVGRRHYSATLFCSPSFAEGVPVVLMEAMARGRPVVATAIAGVRELVRDRQTGLLVTPGRADDLARAIATLLDDATLSARIGEAGRAHVLREFDADRCAALLYRRFCETLGLARTRREAGRPAAKGADPPRERTGWMRHGEAPPAGFRRVQAERDARHARQGEPAGSV